MTASPKLPPNIAVIAGGLSSASEDDKETIAPAAMEIEAEDLGPEQGNEQLAELRELVERFARMPYDEWNHYLENEPDQLKGFDKTMLRRLITATIKEREKKAQAELAFARLQERAERENEQKDKAEKRDVEKRFRELERILALPPSDYDAELKKLAARLSEDIETLREEFAELQEIEDERISADDVEPWLEPVEAGALLRELSAQVEKYLVIHNKHAATAIILWIAFAWIHDVATYSPLLVIQSATEGSGKTNTSKLISFVTPRSKIVTEPSPAGIYTLIDERHPTLILDDADELLARKSDLAHIVNSSWTNGIPLPRKIGGRAVEFDVFCPKVLNGIDVLPHLKPTTRSRCITVGLMPKLPSEAVTDFDKAADDPNFLPLRRKLARFAADNKAAIKIASPVLPEGYTNRLKDNFKLLLAIAEVAGGIWPQRARAAAVALTKEFDEPSARKQLLMAFRDLFRKRADLRGGTRLYSSQVPGLLLGIDEDTWGNFRGDGRPITSKGVADLLRPFGIRPKHFAVPGSDPPTTVRGYEVKQFETAFKYYLPPPRRS
jgi:putative DNA primase/helicase